MPMRLCFKTCTATLALFMALLAPARADFDALSALADSGAAISAVAIDLETNKTLGSLNAATRLAPASVSKIIVAAKALNTWPADRSFVTHLYAANFPVNGVINGDLYLSTEGDSALDHESFIDLASQLHGAGVNRVTGGVVVVTAPFATLQCETQDRCDAMTKSSTAYNALIAGLGVDYGAWCVEIRGTQPRKPALVSSCEGVPMPIAVEGGITTAGPGQRASWWVDRRTEEGTDRLLVGGTVSAGDLQTVYRAMSDPARGAGLLMRETLRSVGVAVQGGIKVRSAAAPASVVEVGRIESLSLQEQLGRMLRFSNNYIADILTMNMAAANGSSISSLADAAVGLNQYVAAANGTPGNPPLLYSGSGLTPESQISAQEVAGLLAAEHRNTRNFNAFYGGLVVPRNAPFRFLRGGSAGWQDRVALKPGTMNDPRSVCGIAGYIRKSNGGFIAFAMLVNGGPRYKHVPLYKAMEAIRADVDVLLNNS